MQVNQVPCKYLRAGCEVTPLEDEKLVHEEKCHFRFCCCPYPVVKCKWQGRINRIVNHYTTFHRLTVLQGETVVFNVDNFTEPGEKRWVMLQSCFDNHFITVMKKDANRKCRFKFFAYVMLFGAKSTSLGFKSRMEMTKGDTKLDWEGKIRCLFDILGVYDTAPDCFIFNYDTAMQLGEANSLNISVTIKVAE